MELNLNFQVLAIKIKLLNIFNHELILKFS